MQTRHLIYVIASLLLVMVEQRSMAHSGTPLRRIISPSQPAWMVHIDVWINPDPQKIIDLVPEDIRPYTIFTIATSSGDERSADGPAIYDSWMKVCAQNRVWTMIQSASGAYNRLPDDDLRAYERYFEDYPNFLGFNFAEQFWGFGDEGCPSFPERLELFADLMELCHEHGGYLAVSFCDSYYNADKMPIAYMRRNQRLHRLLTDDPVHFLCFEKYTLKKNFLDIESQCLGAWLGGYAGQYGIRFDQCGWLAPGDETDLTKGASDFVTASGTIPVAEHLMLTGETMIDGPELVREQCFYQSTETVTEDGFTRRNFAYYPQFENISVDLFRKVLDGTIRIPSREEVIRRTKVCILNDADTYVSPETLFDGLYRSNSDQGGSKNHWIENRWWTKTTGRYPAIPFVYDLLDDEARGLTVIRQSEYESRWGNLAVKKTEMDQLFPEEYSGDIYAGRHENGWVTYNPYQYDEGESDGYRVCSRASKRAHGTIPLQYNTCETISFDYAPYSLGIMKEYKDKITLYLSNYQADQKGTSVTEAAPIEDVITIFGAISRPTLNWQDRGRHTDSRVTTEWKDGIYIIHVEHNGPVDLTVSCSGYGTDRATAYTEAQIEVPELPSVYPGALQYEAECFDYKDIALCQANAYGKGLIGHYGQGFIEMGESRNAVIRTTVSVATAGRYRLCVRYKADKAGSVKVRVGREEALYIMDGTDGEWTEAVNIIRLEQGRNDVCIQNAQSVNVKIDCIILNLMEQQTSVDGVIREKPAGERIFSLQGRQIPVLMKGLNIIRRSDGSVKKIVK